jgi:Asp/Glu/hydantoin racemase
MKTLFLNPNSSAEITEIMRRQIGSQGLPSKSYDIQKLEDAPRIIGSAQDNAIAKKILEENFRQLISGFTRLVLMSSLDTGFESASSMGGIEVYGFTRSVLARYNHLEKGLKVITFDPSMTRLYREIFEEDQFKGVVQSINVLPLAPSAVMHGQEDVINSLSNLCWKLSQNSETPIFILGAVGLRLGEELRKDGLTLIIDPIADLINHLQPFE